MKTIRNLRFVLALCLAFSGCALLAACGQRDDLKALCAGIGLNLSDAQVLSDDDSHGGFHGDGVRLTIIRFNETADEESLRSADGWSPLPLSDEVDHLLHEQLEGVYPSDARIPRAENGYWYFLDRASDVSKPLSERYSYNFTAALYDAESKTLYYCEVDT